MTKAKPFIKWVGGKNQLIEQLNALLPADFDKWKDAVYISNMENLNAEYINDDMPQ